MALGAEVVSHSMIRGVPDPEFDEELGRYMDADPSDHGVILQEALPEPRPGAGGRGAQLPQHQPALARPGATTWRPATTR